MSLRRLILEYVAKHPGQTAVEIARGIGEDVEDISSTLTKQAHKGNLTRISGIGPRGGYGYWPPHIGLRPWSSKP